MKEVVYKVKGIHCASCEILIEKKLLEQKGIESVETSVNSGEVRIEYTGNHPTLKLLNQLFKEDGYTFVKPDSQSDPSARSSSERNRVSDFLFVLSAAAAVIGAYLILKSLNLTSWISVNSGSALPAFFFFGLLSGFSSCAALVGGLVLSMSKQWSEIYDPGSSNSLARVTPHVLFNAGRVISYALLGGILGALGSLFTLSIKLNAALTVLVAILMMFLALQMIGITPLQRFQIAMPRLLTRYVADEKNFKGKLMPTLLGALTFFLPCGFTITVQALAIASGNAVQGALMMLMFALGTVPALLLIGLSSMKLVTKPHVSAKFLKVAGVVVVFFALFLVNSQLNVLGWRSLGDLLPGTRATAEDGFPPIVNGVQVIRMDAKAGSYEPNRFKVKMGVPVRWEISDRGVSGCTNAVISRGLFDGEIRIDEPVVTKEFQPEKVGSYKFSCWMGMVAGVIEVVDPESGDSGDTVDDPSVTPIGSTGSGTCGGGCGGSCGGSCGNPNCPYAQ